MQRLALAAAFANAASDADLVGCIPPFLASPGLAVVERAHAEEEEEEADPEWVRGASGGYDMYMVRGPIASRIRPALWLGRGEFALRPELLHAAGVTHVLTVANDTPDVEAAMRRRVAAGELGYLCMGVGDFGTDEGITRVFGAAFDWIDRAVAAGGVVFVHCANGSNRSPTLVLGYMMHLGYTLDGALRHVLAKRPHIQPLPDNLAALGRCAGMGLMDLDELRQEFQGLKRDAKRVWKRLNAL